LFSGGLVTTEGPTRADVRRLTRICYVSIKIFSVNTLHSRWNSLLILEIDRKLFMNSMDLMQVISEHRN